MVSTCMQRRSLTSAKRQEQLRFISKEAVTLCMTGLLSSQNPRQGHAGWRSLAVGAWQHVPGRRSHRGSPCVALLSGRGRLALGWRVAVLFLSTVLSRSPHGKILLGLPRA